MTKKSSLKLFNRGINLVFFILVVVACNKDESPFSSNDDDNPVNSDGLPHIAINTNGATIVNEPKVNGKITITNDGTISYSGNIAIEFRGSSSQFFPKKSYGFETRDADNADLDVSLLGLPEEEDWILNGPYSDKALIRNVLIYDIARDLNYYASRTEFVELTINGTFQGIYVLMEKLKRDKNRLDIAKLTEIDNLGEEVTGGYIIKVDKNDDGGFNDQNSFASLFGSALDTTASPIRYLYDYPKEDVITTEQKAYISTYITDFETALASPEFTDPLSGYAPYIDVDSFVDFILLNELSNNVDGYRISTFMHKDKNEKLKMGPIWDFNLAFGNADYCDGGETNVWAFRFNERCPGDSLQVPFWWTRLFEDPAFVDKVRTRWNQLRGGVLSNSNILVKVDNYATALNDSGAVTKNFQTWAILGTYVWPNNFVGQSYNQETDYLRTWITDRLAWMDSELSTL